MRMSCSGCRVLRKGCSNNCSIRPCLQWIKSPESQSNATLFLAKFYGRAGLINLINDGPQHLRPAIFRSLLYEACGRIVNPVYGSVGLLWTGRWQLCQAAVEAVLQGQPITQSSSSELALKACDIRHVSKDSNLTALGQLHKVFKSSSASRFKRSARKRKTMAEPPLEFITEFVGAAMSASHDTAVDCCQSPAFDSGSGEGDSMSVETVEASLSKPDKPADRNNLVLDLTLGLTVGDDAASK